MTLRELYRKLADPKLTPLEKKRLQDEYNKKYNQYK
jgi:hypothetical protein